MNNKTKKLCLVIPSLQAGGMERVMSELARYFCKKNQLNVFLILYGKKPELFYDVPDNLFIYRPSTIFSVQFRFISTLDRFLFLRRTVKKIDPHFILSFGEYWNSFVILALIGLSYPIYISDRCSPAKKYNIFHTFLRRWLYPKSAGIIAQTEKARRLFQSNFRHDNIVVIGNPIKPISDNSVSKKKIVLTVGRLINSKNHDKLIELFCKINAIDWKLIIIGGDSLNQSNMSRLKNLISSLNAESKVTLMGYRVDLDVFYQQSSIFAFTSVSEGFPNVIGEAMSAGLPVISFDCIAGPSEMITDGVDGYLIPVNNFSLFLERLNQLMTDVTLCREMGLNAKKSIKRFSSDSIGDKYYKFITTG